MDLQNSTIRSAGAPECFGHPELWDRNNPECAGGPDASYAEGRGLRPQCSFFSSCGVRVATQTNGRLGSFVPASQLVRPAVVTPQPATPTPSYQPYASQPAPTTTQTSGFADYMRNMDAQRRQAIGQPPAPYMPAQGASGWVANYGIPAFLTAQEVRYPGESWWAPFLRSVLRGIGKAIGHVAAHYFDTHVMRHQPPEEKKNGP